jgi:hypothetical protein
MFRRIDGVRVAVVEERIEQVFRWKYSYLKPTKTELELWEALHYQKHAPKKKK